MSGTRLTRDAILAAPDLPREEVEVPEWGGTVLVSAMSGLTRDAFEAVLLSTPTPDRNARATFAAFCIVDDEGERVFDPADIAALGQKSSRALDRVVAVAQRLSRFGDKELEAALGNSEPSPSDGSTSV
jgi:hypothetical protein